MANNFKSYASTGITTETVVFTCPALTQTTVIGMTVANTTTTDGTTDVILNKSGGASAKLVPGSDLYRNDTLVAIGGEQKVVLEPGDTISVIASVASDTVLSTLEISS